MPLTSKGKKILSSMKKQYGAKKGERIFYSSINKGKITGAEGKTKKKKGRIKVSIHRGRKVK